MCDTENHWVQVFGLDGTFVRQWGGKGAGPGQFNMPDSVAVVGDAVIICDAGILFHAGVRVGWRFYEAVGRAWKRPGAVLFSLCCGCERNEVIVSDGGNHRISMQVFGLDGTFTRQWGGQA